MGITDVEERRRYCPQCEKFIPGRRSVMKWTTGCLVSIFTLGLFIPIWGLIEIFKIFKPYICPECGSETRSSETGGKKKPPSIEEIRRMLASP